MITEDTKAIFERIKEYTCSTQKRFRIKISKDFKWQFYNRRHSNFSAWISPRWITKNRTYYYSSTEFYVRAHLDSIDDSYCDADSPYVSLEEAIKLLKVARGFLSQLPRDGVTRENWESYFKSRNFTLDYG